MKKTAALSIALAAAMTLFSCGKDSPGEKNTGKVEHSGETRWYSYKEGFAKALKEKKPMVIDFYADWCKWCKVMDKETFADSEVANKMNREFVAIRIHMDRPSQEPIQFKKHRLSPQEFSHYMGVKGLPTLVFLDATGEPITMLPGFVKKTHFLPVLGYISEKCYAKNIAFESYMKGNSSCSR